MKLSSILLVYVIPRTKEEKSSVDLVKKTLEKYKINYSLANRDKLSASQFHDKDLILAVGGDGTFLRASHFIDKQLIFGINSDTKNKEGFFMKSDKNDFRAKFEKIVKNKFQVKKLARLEASINSKRVETLALNEFYIGPVKAYHAATYWIKVNGIEERQKSSGVLVSTPCGSYAWTKSCCNKALPLDSSNFQFVVREPYERKVFKDYKLKYGMLKNGQVIHFTSEMLDGIIMADSVGSEYNFKYGSKAEIKLSNRPLNAIWL